MNYALFDSKKPSVSAAPNVNLVLSQYGGSAAPSTKKPAVTKAANGEVNIAPNPNHRKTSANPHSRKTLSNMHGSNVVTVTNNSINMPAKGG